MMSCFAKSVSEMALTYVTRVRVRISDIICIGYADTHFLKRKLTKIVYPRIQRVSDTDTSSPLEYPCNIGSNSIGKVVYKARKEKLFHW